MTISFVRFGNFSGLKINGVDRVKAEFETPLEKASWVTSQVESGGRVGAVISYDGTGVTAGIHQAIAIYPRQPQAPAGPLWKTLLRFQKEGVAKEAMDKLMALLKSRGLAMDAAGEPRRALAEGRGKKLTQDELWKALGSPKGVTPNTGPGRKEAEQIVKAFHEVFKHPETFEVQEALAQEHIVTSAKRQKLVRSKQKAARLLSIADVVYRDGEIGTEPEKTEEDFRISLAMSVFWCYYVNAPGMATTCIGEVYDTFKETPPELGEFAARLIRRLGTSTYGRWSHKVANGRYQRTREFCMRVYPSGLFSGEKSIMPKNFVGA